MFTRDGSKILNATSGESAARAMIPIRLRAVTELVFQVSRFAVVAWA
jgi:hypothetical protein